MRVKTDAKRGEILAAASIEFAERGFHDAKIGDIAARLGSSKATIYNYFPSKFDLFWEMLAEKAAPVMSGVLGHLDGTGCIRTRLFEFCQAYLRIFTHPFTIATQRLMITEAARSPEPARLRDRADLPGWSMIAEKFANAQMKGDLREGDPAIMAIQLRALLEGGLPLRQLYGGDDVSDIEVDAVARDIAEFFLRACGPT